MAAGWQLIAPFVVEWVGMGVEIADAARFAEFAEATALVALVPFW